MILSCLYPKHLYNQHHFSRLPLVCYTNIDFGYIFDVSQFFRISYSELSMYEKLSTLRQCVLWNYTQTKAKTGAWSTVKSVFSSLLLRKRDKAMEEALQMLSLVGSNSSPCSSRSDSQAVPQRLQFHEVAVSCTLDHIALFSPTTPTLTYTLACGALQPSVQKPQVLAFPLCQVNVQTTSQILVSTLPMGYSI